MGGVETRGVRDGCDGGPLEADLLFRPPSSSVRLGLVQVVTVRIIAAAPV